MASSVSRKDFQPIQGRTNKRKSEGVQEEITEQGTQGKTSNQNGVQSTILYKTFLGNQHPHSKKSTCLLCTQFNTKWGEFGEIIHDNVNYPASLKSALGYTVTCKDEDIYKIGWVKHLEHRKFIVFPPPSSSTRKGSVPRVGWHGMDGAVINAMLAHTICLSSRIHHQATATLA